MIGLDDVTIGMVMALFGLGLLHLLPFSEAIKASDLVNWSVAGACGIGGTLLVWRLSIRRK